MVIRLGTLLQSLLLTQDKLSSPVLLVAGKSRPTTDDVVVVRKGVLIKLRQILGLITSLSSSSSLEGASITSSSSSSSSDLVWGFLASISSLNVLFHSPELGYHKNAHEEFQCLGKVALTTINLQIQQENNVQHELGYRVVGFAGGMTIDADVAAAASDRQTRTRQCLQLESLVDDTHEESRSGRSRTEPCSHGVALRTCLAKLAKKSVLEGIEELFGGLDPLVGVVWQNACAIAPVDGCGKIDLDGSHLACSCWFGRGCHDPCAKSSKARSSASEQHRKKGHHLLSMESYSCFCLEIGQSIDGRLEAGLAEKGGPCKEISQGPLLQRNPRGSSITEFMIDVDLFLDFLDAWNPLGQMVEYHFDICIALSIGFGITPVCIVSFFSSSLLGLRPASVSYLSCPSYPDGCASLVDLVERLRLLDSGLPLLRGLLWLTWPARLHQTQQQSRIPWRGRDQALQYDSSSRGVRNQ
ncbi:hypothetical protein KCV07_g197, partial [Aureobasidium melanogenum]